MKRIFCMLLAVLLFASLGTATFAEESVLDIDIMGIRMNYPEEFKELQGILEPDPSGIIAYDPDVYYMSIDYYAMSQEQLDELINKTEDELTEADYEFFLSSYGTIGEVLACEGGIETALSAFGLDELPEEMKMTEIGSADKLHYYYITQDDDEEVSGFEEKYAQEAAALKGSVLEMLKSAEYYSPVDPIAKTVGKVVRFETTDLDGNVVSSEDLFSANEITMINYWGTWCIWCVRELPELAKIHSRLQEKDCGIIGILQDGDDPEKVELAKSLMKENGTNYPNVVLSDDMSFLDMVSSFPTSFFVDREGRILCYPIAGAAVNEYEPTVDTLLAGSLPAM